MQSLDRKSIDKLKDGYLVSAHIDCILGERPVVQKRLFSGLS